MRDLLETITSHIDDAASLGDAEGARELSIALWRMSCAASRRANAIRARLDGRVNEAIAHEKCCDRLMDLARSLGTTDE